MNLTEDPPPAARPLQGADNDEEDHSAPCETMDHIPTSSYLTDLVFGRESDGKKIIEFLLDNEENCSDRPNYSVVAVTGTKGAGKTTLVQYVYNKEEVKNHFRVTMWLHISPILNITECTKQMIVYASGEECPNLPSLDLLQGKLIEELKNKSGNIMIVLDDIQYKNNDEVAEGQWKSLLAPFASQIRGPCKFVVTSRLSSFPLPLLPNQLIELGNLAPNDFRSLLRHLVWGVLQIRNSQLSNESSTELGKVLDRKAQIMSEMGAQPMQAKFYARRLFQEQDIESFISVESFNLGLQPPPGVVLEEIN